MQQDEDSNHTPARKPNSLTPSEIEFLRQDALKMHEVAKAYFARRTDEDLWSEEGPASAGNTSETRLDRRS
jgi:hypothetical protein